MTSRPAADRHTLFIGRDPTYNFPNPPKRMVARHGPAGWGGRLVAARAGRQGPRAASNAKTDGRAARGAAFGALGD